MKKTLIFILYLFILTEIFFRFFFPGSDITQVMEWSLDPDLMYTLKPGASMIFDGQMVRLPPSNISINSYGMRDNVLSSDKNGKYRIAFIGDSIVFGWGLDINKTFIKRLEGILNRTLDRNDIECLNFGVFGYNIKQYLGALKDKAMDWHPDVVVIVLNRDDLINVAEGFNPLRQGWIRVAKPIFYASRVCRMFAVWSVLIRNRIRFQHTDPAWEATAYQDIISMTKSVRSKDIPVLYYVYQESHLTQSLFQRVELLVKDTNDTETIFLRKSSICDDEKYIFKGDPHPNNEGSGCIANDLAEFFLSHKELLTKD